MKKKKNSADLTLRNLGPVRALQQEVRRLKTALKEQGFRVDEAFSRIEGLESQSLMEEQ